MEDSFGEKWRKIPDYGFEPKTEAFRLQWYLNCYGWGTLENLAEFLATRKRILDVGTGLSGHVKLYAEHTKGEVYGIDNSPSIKLAQEHLKNLPSVHLLQMDLMDMPFPLGYFDFIVANQVLHHTQNTEKAFKGLVPYLQKGGQIAIYVYKKKGAVREYCDDELRKFTTKMPLADCLKFSEAVTAFGKALSEIDLGLQRFVYWNILKCFWNGGFDWETNMATNFDWYRPQYAWRHTPEEVRRWFADMKLEILHEDVSESGISVRGIK